ncbi:hypothetical protein ACIQCG_34145 [Streptomyces noursei]|uniref:hypothetical protein n=1 Tax=Streptomyces noursei TaxID=1971 RepID=UPI00381F9A7B
MHSDSYREATRQDREVALHKAHAAYAHADRVKRLEEQTDAWRQAKHLTEYVTAVRERTTALTPEPKLTEIEKWLAFAEAPQRLSDTATTPNLHTPPTSSSTDLAPLLAQQAFANRTFPHSQMR